MNLDIASTALLAQLAAAEGPAFHEMTPDEARLVGAEMAKAYPAGPDMHEVRNIDVPTPDGGSFRTRILIPSASPKAVFIYYHGGGWVLSDIDAYDTVGRRLAERTGAAVVMVDYRKAPEFRYPTAPNDAWEALSWVDGHLSDIAGRRVPIIVGGDSAGGNLAAIVAQRATREGNPSIALQVLIYPVTDASMTQASYADPNNQLLLNTPLMQWFWDHYAPNPEDRKNVDASPANAADLSGLPAAIVLTAQYDVLTDEAEAYAARMAAAGVPVTTKRFDRQLHNFFAMPGMLPAADAGLEYIGQQVDKHLSKHSTVDAVIVGAGFSGMYQLHKLRQMGLNARVIEAGDDVGGTWYWNRYPGARCDIESMEYSYSFSSELEQEWNWSERYAAQPEILTYAQHVAERFDLKRDITFKTRVERADYDEERAQWTVQTDTGEAISAQYLIMATGCLSVVKRPDIKGHDDFSGPTFTTGLWPHEGVDFTGKRVAVIGTGSSGIQSIPEIAAQASSVTVYQRTPAYSLPAFNRPLTEAEIAETKANYEDLRARQRTHPSANPNPPRTFIPSYAVGDNERKAMYEDAWNSGRLTALSGVFSDIIQNQEANDEVAEFIRNKVRETVKDRDVAETLAPKGYPFATKRACLDTNYYETFNQDHVNLVDLHKTPIEEITPSGIRTSAGEEDYDCIVYATGFDAMTGALMKVDIRGVGGTSLRDKWADGPHNYMGLSIAGFPNLFTITGPSSPSVLSNMLVSIEQHVDWVSGCIKWMRDHGHAAIEATPEAEHEWAVHNEQLANLTLFPQANSWYIGANVPGKPRTFMAYIGGVDVYRFLCDQIAAAGYEGFVTSSAPARVAA